MLELQQLAYRYPAAERMALQPLDLHLQPGQCLGLLGGNGAGKSTLLSLLAGVLPLQSGRLLWQGPRSIGLVPQQLAFYAGLRVAENLELFADLYRLRGAERRQRLTQCLDDCDLHAHLGRRAGQLSGGEQRRLNLAIGLLQPARLYLLDEATVGVDATHRQQLLHAVQRLAENGHAVIYTSHYLDEVERVAGRILLLHEGRVCLDVQRDSLSAGPDELLLEWAGAAPEGFERLLAELQLVSQASPGGLHVPAIDGRQLLQIQQWLLAHQCTPRLLRFGQPSLEQRYLRLNGGRL